MAQLPNDSLKYIDIAAFHQGETKNIHYTQELPFPENIEACNNNTVSVSFKGALSYDGSIFTLEGAVNAKYVAPCARCLKDTGENITFRLKERFVKEGFINKHTSEKNNPKNNYEEIVVKGNRIDIADTILICLIPEMPLKTICSENCKGLCPYCGCDLNINDCSCEAPIDPRLDGLKHKIKLV